MRTIIHDLNDKDFKKMNFSNEDFIINACNCKNNCIGCFSCWIKHPKKCIYKDEFSEITEKLRKSNELIIISESKYGCYSTNIKRVLERCIGYILPYFCIRDNMVHHKERYNSKITFNSIFYGDIDEGDKKCLDSLVKATSINLNALCYKVSFYKNIKEIKNEFTN